MSLSILSIPTSPFTGMNPGTSGLRKQVKVFQQPHYLANFVSALFSTVLPTDSVSDLALLVGGDGRYFNDVAVQVIIKTAAAVGFAKVVVGKDGLMSTPAASAVIRKRKLFGGVLLTASHNPGGPDGDFGIKYNVGNGGPAQESLTGKVYEKTKLIQEYKIADFPDVDVSKIGVVKVADGFEVEVIDPVDDYLQLLKTIFDFEPDSLMTISASCFIVNSPGLPRLIGPNTSFGVSIILTMPSIKSST